MATFNKFHSFVTAKAAGTHAGWLNADTDVVKVMLTNVAPLATNSLKSHITEIAAGNGYTAGGQDIQNAASTSSGVITVAGTDFTWLAAGGSIGPFRYAVAYNDTATNDPLIGWWDYGSSITLADTESLVFDLATNLLQDF
jgi:hypothetical protein